MDGDHVAAQRFAARVETLLIADGGGFETRAVPALSLGFAGIEGDLHRGMTRRSGGREPWYPRGTEMANERQISIVSRAELAIAAARMEIESILPEWIGANLVLGEIEALSHLPAGTRLFGEGGVTIFVAGQNAPCRHAGRAIAQHFAGREGLDLSFAREARGLRGVVGFVERAGTLKAGEGLTVSVPAQRLYRRDVTPLC